jgi:hypothetical protein
LTVAAAPPVRVLRSVMPPAPPAPVRRPRADRTPKVEEVSSENPMDALASRVRAIMGEGAADLSRVTAQVVGELPLDQGFATAGKIAELAAHLGRPELQRERPWVPVCDGLVIEDWRIEPPSGGA